MIHVNGGRRMQIFSSVPSSLQLYGHYARNFLFITPRLIKESHISLVLHRLLLRRPSSFISNWQELVDCRLADRRSTLTLEVTGAPLLATC